MNDFRNDTDLLEEPPSRATRGERARADEGGERDSQLVIARVIHRIGGGIRWSYNRNLAWAFAISLGVHVLIIGLYALSHLGDDRVAPTVVPPLGSLDSLIVDTNFIAIDMRQVTVIKEGGGGGDPALDAPVGKSKAGDPDAQPKYVPEKPKSTKPEKVFDQKSPTKVKPVDKPKNDDRPVATTDRDTAKGPSSGIGHKGQHADGKGTENAGGSGGRGVGNGVGIGVGDGSGLGSRGWIRRPRGGRSANLEASGRVVLSCTVMPNGDITNITPVKKAHPSLVADAVRRLSAAKARPLPDDAPQAPVKIQIPFTYDFD
jgi:outer membrane biosynthesis protein TonB